jgi:mannitol/fructose-specific phosphotransferase system IIA component (Ntr-type)
MQTKAKDYWKHFKPSTCSIRLKGATAADVFEELVTNMVRSKVLPEELKEEAMRALQERERLASTGVGKNVAIPHVKLKGLEEVAVSLSIHPDGVDWNSLDGEPVHILFTVLRPESAGVRHDPDRHLDMMRWISQLARESDFRNFARRVKNRTDLVALLREMSAPGS